VNTADAVPSAAAATGLPLEQFTVGDAVFEQRDGQVVVLAASRPDGVPADPQTPLCFLDPVVGLRGAGGPVRVRLAERDGSQVLLRQVDPGEPEPERVPLYDGDELIVMEALSHISLRTSPVPGVPEDFLFSYRIIPVRSEPGRVLARTLRHGEPDTGQRVHVRPGDQLELVDVTVELDHIDSQEIATDSGHVPLTPVLWTWLSLGEGHDPARTRYLLAAARRLDTANQLLMVMQDRRRLLDQEGLGGPQLRRHLFDLIGAVEMAVVALGRAVDMVRQAAASIGCTVPVPTQVTSSWPALHEIRNAYEHIEDRALGQVRARPHAEALTIFDQRRLLSDAVLVYGQHELDIDREVPRLLAEVRQFLKDAASDG
jgi:hypothetical protein